MKKSFASLALVCAMGSAVALAEESGAFIGIDLTKTSYAVSEATRGSERASAAPEVSGFGAGIIAGYKSFFDENFGARYYLQVNYGGASTGGYYANINALNVYLNADALANIVNSGDSSFGAFAGLSLGLASYTGSYFKNVYDKSGVSGFDFGINLGLRAILAKNHGIEIAWRVSPSQVSKKYSGDDNSASATPDRKARVSQPSSVGIRYTFNF